MELVEVRGVLDERKRSVRVTPLYVTMYSSYAVGLERGVVPMGVLVGVFCGNGYAANGVVAALMIGALLFLRGVGVAGAGGRG
jgi:hypothetical protein